MRTALVCPAMAAVGMDPNRDHRESVSAALEAALAGMKQLLCA
jgi:hypothetical protein